MSKAAFPVNDLLRRKWQTGLTVATLTLSVTSTFFLLLFSRRMGVGLASADDVLTHGLSTVFSQFIIFIGILIFAVGAVITSFIVFLMMKQRTRDFGLIKAAGCPNGLVFAYFLTELLTITFVSCALGVTFAYALDSAVAHIFQLQAYPKLPDLWLALLVFAAFFALALIFGVKPLLEAARLSPIKALSPIQYFGISADRKHKPLSKFVLTLRIASRSLFRRQAASIRVVLLLSIVFMLLTVAVAGSIIANDTTKLWIKSAIGEDTIIIAHNSMCTQYRLLLSKFSGATENGDFDYLNVQFAIPDALIQRLKATSAVAAVDARLICKAHVYEVRNFTIDPETLATIPVGDNREGDSLIVGVDPENVITAWTINGRFLATADAGAAVIGDSLAQTMFSQPLVQSARLYNKTFSVVGVCVDPINNGRVIYVPLKQLQNITSMPNVNLLLVKIAPSADHEVALAQIKREILSLTPDFAIMELNNVLQESINFLGSAWLTVMLLPLFTLASAALCLVGYIMLAVDEQRQEFAILRAIGVKPNTIIAILAVQSIVVLLSSFAVGLSLGIITTVLILVPNPVVTSLTILEVALWLLVALTVMLLLSLYPAIRFAKTPLLKILT
ncbi:MAG: ABC transporter permease [Candidatus Bathyarchaeota archaeon]|nr:ABC transporter permease [Candidatus Bathyarchaeota archaeon]